MQRLYDSEEWDYVEETSRVDVVYNEWLRSKKERKYPIKTDVINILEAYVIPDLLAEIDQYIFADKPAQTRSFYFPGDEKDGFSNEELYGSDEVTNKVHGWMLHFMSQEQMPVIRGDELRFHSMVGKNPNSGVYYYNGKKVIGMDYYIQDYGTTPGEFTVNEFINTDYFPNDYNTKVNIDWTGARMLRNDGLVKFNEYYNVYQCWVQLNNGYVYQVLTDIIIPDLDTLVTTNFDNYDEGIEGIYIPSRSRLLTNVEK